MREREQIDQDHIDALTLSLNTEKKLVERLRERLKFVSEASPQTLDEDVTQPVAQKGKGLTRDDLDNDLEAEEFANENHESTNI